MDQSLSDIRKAENEVVFRNKNEQAVRHIAETRKVAAEEGQEAEIKDMDDIKLLFYCECLDDTCRQRISMTPKEYEDAHKNSSQFTLIPGHHFADIERIVFDADKYIIVEKFMTPPVKAEKLNPI